MNDIFHFVERPYNLRRDYTSRRKRDRTVYHGSEYFFPCSQIVGSSTKLNKNYASLKEFKTKVNTWGFELCPCKICKKYAGILGFI